MQYPHVMLPRLDVRHLRLLSAISEAGSLTGACRRLHLTQPALSRQLRDAEERLGTPLFLRSARRLVPTTAGRELLAASGGLLADLEAAEARALALEGKARGRVRLATECYTGYHWLPPVLARFAASHPQVDVVIELDATRQAVEALQEGRLDVALLHRPGRNPRLRTRELFRDELVVVAAPGAPLARRARLRASDLAGETLLIYPPASDSFVLQEVLRPARVVPQRVIEVPLTEAILELAAAGEGVGVLARWAVRPWEEAGRIAVRPLAAAGARRTWRAATLASAQVPACVADFVEILATSDLRPPTPPGPEPTRRGPRAREGRRA